MKKGSYKLLMHDENRKELLSLPFDVTRPLIYVSPENVGTCEKIYVSYSGAPGLEIDWIGMYGITSPDRFHIQKMPIGGRNCGDMTFRAPSQPGQYDFRMFKDDVYRQILGQSNVVTVN
ncbi:MAG: hypothetical protein MUO26_02825 [Methanotrichaceae archaeon]|nr:hypothetical protein [Methanotrichaceae archaeon]